MQYPSCYLPLHHAGRHFGQGAFQRERAQGKFNLNVRVKTTLSYWFFPHKGTYYYQYDCWLKFPPVPGNATPAFAGGGFQCGVTK